MKQLEALKQFYDREKHTEAPMGHVEVVDGEEVQLGTWLAYVRQKKRGGTLSDEIIAGCLLVNPDFSWTKRKTGPKVRNSVRDLNIYTLHASGVSLEKIAEQYGISRQRVHQICQKVQSTA